MDPGDEPENDASENSDQTRLPWTWRLDDEHPDGSLETDLGKNLQLIYSLSKDEMKVVDRDGKSPLCSFVADWPEALFLSLVRIMMTDYKRGNNDGSGNDGDSSNSNSDADMVPLSPIEADNLGRALVDYACERDGCFSYIVSQLVELSPDQMNNSIVVAASCGYPRLVEYLCETIKDSDSKDKILGPGQAAIEASKRGFTDVLRWLSRLGTDLSFRDCEGMSPLHHAAYGRHADAVQFLLREGGDPNQLDKAGRSPLFCGCESGSDIVITLLREKGASAIRENDGSTLLDLAAYQGNIDVVRRLLDLDGGAAQLGMLDRDTSRRILQSPLHIAAREGHSSIVKLLAAEGFPVHVCDAGGRTPLSYASEGGYLETVEFLLTKTPHRSVDDTDHSQRTALSYAAAGGHTDVVAALLSYGGANPNVRDDLGRTALIYAAKGGHDDTVVVITLMADDNPEVKRKVVESFDKAYSRYFYRPTGDTAVDVNVEDNNGLSAMSYLVQSDKRYLARYLLAVGQTPRSETPVDEG